MSPGSVRIQEGFLEEEGSCRLYEERGAGILAGEKRKGTGDKKNSLHKGKCQNSESGGRGRHGDEDAGTQAAAVEEMSWLEQGWGHRTGRRGTPGGRVRR